MNLIKQPDKYTLNAFRGIFAVLILVHHYDPLNSGLYFDLGGPIVLFFFILSGYLTYYNWYNKISSDNGAQLFLTKRLSKIFALQWISMLLLGLLCVVLQQNRAASIWAYPCQFLLIQSFIPFWEIHFSFNGPSWFLSSLLFCYIMSPALLSFIKRRGIVVFSIILVICFTAYYVILNNLSESIGWRWLTYINPGVRLLEYSTGIFIGYIWVNYNKRFSKSINYLKISIFELIILLISFFIVFSKVFDAYLSFTKYIPDLINMIILSCLILTFSIGQGFFSKILHNKVLQYLGDLSMMIYIIQIVPIAIVIKYIQPHTSVLSSFIILIVFTLLLSHLLIKYIFPIVLRFTSKLFEKILFFKCNKSINY